MKITKLVVKNVGIVDLNESFEHLGRVIEIKECEDFFKADCVNGTFYTAKENVAGIYTNERSYGDFR